MKRFSTVFPPSVNDDVFRHDNFYFTSFAKREMNPKSSNAQLYYY